MPTCIILAQELLEPHATVERMVTQPESATAADGFRYSSANFYGFAPAPTEGSVSYPGRSFANLRATGAGRRRRPPTQQEKSAEAIVTQTSG